MARGPNRHKGGRKANRRELRPAFHILCEGQNTEPEYFKQFPINNIAHCRGYARSNTALVKEAIKYKRRERINKSSVDQVWVVFDYDVNPLIPNQKEDYNAAIDLAEKNNILCAVSNDAFELWYVLHFQNCNAQQRRDWYLEKLKEFIGSYDKDKKKSSSMYRLLIDKQGDAIQRAELLVKESEGEKPADKNPFTTVHLLVQQLNEFIP